MPSRGIAAYMLAATLTVATTALHAQFPTITTSVAGEARYARYTPFACSVMPDREGASVVGAQLLTWHDRWPASVLNAGPADSIAYIKALQVTAREIQQCLAKFPIDRTPARQLYGVGKSWLSVENEAQAEAAFQALLNANASAPLAERAWWLGKLVSLYGGGGPERYARAMRYMKELDALGIQAAGFRLTARNALYQVAVRLDSLQLMEEHMSAALRVHRELAGDARREWINASVAAAMNKADFEARRWNYPAAVTWLKQAREELGAIDPDVRKPFDDALAFKYEVYGTPARPLQAKWVYMPGQSTPTTTIARPTPGKVSLLIYADRGGSLMPVIMQINGVIQRLIDRASPQFEATLLTETTGSDGFKPVSHQEEAQIDADFFHTYLKMPAPLVIWSNEVVGHRDDGRIERSGSPNVYPEAWVVLIDRKGIIRAISGFAVPPEKRWHRMIQELSKE